MRWVAVTLILCTLNFANSFADTQAVRSADIIETLAKISEDPRVLDHLGAGGRIIEVAGYEIGVAIRYTNSVDVRNPQQCIGFYYEVNVNEYAFQTDERCSKSNNEFMKADSLQDQRISYLDDIEVMAKAAKFSMDLAGVIRPRIFQVMGLVKKPDRVVVTYKGPGPVSHNFFTFGITPKKHNGVSWEFVQDVAYLNPLNSRP